MLFLKDLLNDFSAFVQLASSNDRMSEGTFSCIEADLVNTLQMSSIMRKTDFCLCENKGADQLRSNCEADQRL